MTNKNPLYIAYFDGACEPKNPGGTAAYGAVIFRAGERIWECSEIYQPEKGHERETSNNVAEYAGLIAVLEWFADQKLFDAQIIVRGDSELVIRQIFGSWSIKKGAYVELAFKARELVARFTNIHGRWVGREKNEIADRLSKDALKKAGVKLRLQPV